MEALFNFLEQALVWIVMGCCVNIGTPATLPTISALLCLCGVTLFFAMYVRLLIPIAFQLMC